MRVKVPCATCANVADPKKYQFRIFDGELDDVGYVHVACDKGHKSIVVYDSRRYEVLLESATSALLAGYANEAISTFSTALERCYEFYIRVVLRSRGIAPGEIDKSWKEVAAQSERQFGAFHFLRLLEHGKPLNLNAKIATTRNSVVHRGKIATTEDALEFGGLVYARIKEIEDSLSKNKKDVEAEQKHEVESQKQQVPEGVEYVVMNAFSVKVDPETDEVVGLPDTFQEYLAGVQRGKETGWIA
ncbi:hypothetical protein [Sulfuriflexus sp.]|uniref:hypothetical protein n=1 Tax=Sulfuriflexus sp. TaxID=2015443 RepID=UPI0028CE651D|nr:hypothetical protein [Sulfuriflexus sp.]MDT8403973.1 hypothetical protein [Sulfuriflexus sp.]